MVLELLSHPMTLVVFGEEYILLNILNDTVIYFQM